MYLHLGQETVVKTRDIIGIFDLDTTTVGKPTRDFLAASTKRNEVVNVTYELPKSFVIVKPNKIKDKKGNKIKGDTRVYISKISTATLNKRNKKV